MTPRSGGNAVEGAPHQSAASSTASPEKASPPTFSKARLLLLGHRGARHVSRIAVSRGRKAIPPENTIASFEYALTHGCDGFEFDVRITQDHRLVLCHDARIGRQNVSALSFERLCSIGKPRLACLEEVLQAFADRAYLDIEVKVAGGEEVIVKALDQCPPSCGYLLSSFLPEVLLRLHQLDSSLPLGYVCQHSTRLPLWRELPIQVFLPHHKLITEKLIREVHDRGCRIFTWTVNCERDVHRLSLWGVDGLISDDPDLLSRTFRPFETPSEKRNAKREQRSS